MYSIRQNKVSRLLQKDLATIFQELTRSSIKGRMISVTVVRVSKDLAVAKVYLSIFPSEGASETLNLIKQLSGQIRGELGRKVGKQLRIVPELAFFLDDSLDYIDHIDDVLTQKP
ncbi:MAG: 30S ribosome-binding factor RbfA [Prolixibacteraceae bacterium]|nr:30S ribosome-binding factor RbfA [Prolixibacteraceae bacterium]MBN2648726.1 30S ribosome-binding factor RbfA [Prolixibacteraceae bacterium]